jgi:predicted ester cyclase
LEDSVTTIAVAELGSIHETRIPMPDIAERNRELALAMNREVWNERRLDRIPYYFTTDFVADYSPRGIREGHDGVRAMVEGAHSSFRDFAETVHRIIADDQHVVLHFTISGVHVGPWGPIEPTGRPVKFDEIVIMRVTGGKFSHQWGVSDSLIALQQIGVIRDPAGFTDG